ncbi:MAG: hypothetical protein M5U09_14675 [Gammaproteobacteria bacterium]|nr:hypothetical protein [Gammaproteobacteria bacterium]
MRLPPTSMAFSVESTMLLLSMKARASLATLLPTSMAPAAELLAPYLAAMAKVRSFSDLEALVISALSWASLTAFRVRSASVTTWELAMNAVARAGSMPPKTSTSRIWRQRLVSR